MATRKEAKRKSLIQMLTIAVGVCIVVVVVVLAQKWLSSRPGTPPQEVAILATVEPGTSSTGQQSLELTPYMACELGEQCEEGQVPNLTVGPDDMLHLEIPAEISGKQWRVLTIYDDPAANDEKIHGPNETTKVDIAGSTKPLNDATDKRPRLQLVEVSALMIGIDQQGAETPVSTVWSLSTMTPQELAEAKAAK